MPLEYHGTIESPRLLMRLATPGDVDDLFAINADDEVTHLLPYASWRTAEDARGWFERANGLAADGTGLQYVLLERASGRVIGTCLLFRYEAPSARAEIGYVLGRAYWGRGLMHEALSAFISDAFHSRALRRLEAEVNPQNTRSMQLLRRLGFGCEGLLRQRWCAKGRCYDTHVFGLLRDEWPHVPGLGASVPAPEVPP